MSLLSRLTNTASLAYHICAESRYPYRPIEAILRDQERRVQAIVAYAYRFVPYYHETMDRLGLAPSSLQSAADLARLPLLTREHLQRDPEYYVSQRCPLREYHRLTSSGSTGRPCTIYRDADSLFLSAAYGDRGRVVIGRLIGNSFGYRKTMIWRPGGTARDMHRFWSERAFLPADAGFERQYLSLAAPLDENIARINDFQPDLIDSYGAYLAMLFLRARATGELTHRPRAVRYTADALSPQARAVITAEFGVPVFSDYEATECDNIGFECECHTGLHVNVDLCPVRIVDAEGRSLPPGASGEVVVSNLINTGTVLLNYGLGDVAALLPEACPCGRTLPLMSQIEARGDDWVEAPDGHIVHPVAVAGPLNSPEHVWQWQVVQESAVDYRLLLVVDDAFDRQVAGAQLEQALSAQLGATAVVRVEYVAPHGLQRTAAGKTPRVISLRRRLAWEAA